MLLNIRKAWRWFHAFFFAAAISNIAAPQAAQLPASCMLSKDQLQQSQAQSIHSVIDGDSIRLSPHRSLRLIGINTPEMRRQSLNIAEPLAQEAKAMLQRLTANGIFWYPGEQAQDRYDRQLGYAYNRQGQSLSGLLLQQGLGFSVAVPPNLANLDCQLAAQQQAKEAGLGVWSEAYFAVKQARKLGPKDAGFQRLIGRVTNIRHSKQAIWLQLDGDIVIKIARNDLAALQPLQPTKLLNRQLIIQGWISDRSDWAKARGFSSLRLDLKHASQIEQIL